MNEDESDIANALNSIAAALRMLGTADAATPMGAIEVLSMEIKSGSEAIAGAIGDLAEAIREHGRDV